MKELILATVVAAVATVGVAVVCLVCTERVIKMCDERIKEAQ